MAGRRPVVFGIMSTVQFRTTEVSGASALLLPGSRYDRGVDDPVIEWTAEQRHRSFAKTQPSTADDVSITADGRRLDTAAKVIAYVEEFNRTHPTPNAATA
jgi:hypothetical protein